MPSPPCGGAPGLDVFGTTRTLHCVGQDTAQNLPHRAGQNWKGHKAFLAHMQPVDQRLTRSAQALNIVVFRHPCAAAAVNPAPVSIPGACVMFLAPSALQNPKPHTPNPKSYPRTSAARPAKESPGLQASVALRHCLRTQERGPRSML